MRVILDKITQIRGNEPAADGAFPQLPIIVGKAKI